MIASTLQRKKPALMLLFGIAVALTCGVLIGVQPAINAEVSRRLASPFAAVLFSLLVSTAIVLPFAFLQDRAPIGPAIASAPWWVWLGGLAGAAFVTAGITIAPIMGIALFLMIVVTGQLAAASFADHFALFGTPKRPMTLSRCLGVGLALVGVLTFRFGRF